MYERVIDLATPLRHRSLFLFGARQTGKSTLLRQRFPDARFVDLLAADTFRELSAAPERLRQTLTGRETLIVVDEVQKLPSLLDEVHLLIERNKRLRVLLTGSSARKLRRGGANLLAGRAWTRFLSYCVLVGGTLWAGCTVRFLMRQPSDVFTNVSR